MTPNVARAEDMRVMFTAGLTLQAIGDKYSLSRERVRQILKNQCSLNGALGGRALITFIRSERPVPPSKLDARCLVTMGCSRVNYQELTGSKYATVDLHAARFITQKNNAKKRGIAWAMTFPEWWAIWQASGHYQDLKGIGSYCMARIHDTGGYSVGNVYICTFAQNSHDQYFSGKTRKRAIVIHATPKKLGDSYYPDSMFLASAA